MVALGLLGCMLLGIFAQIHPSRGYESGSLSMYQAMTFYETFGLEIAYKIIKKKLGCRVYIFSNLTQIWHDEEAIQYYDQVFMLVIGKTTKMYNLFEKLEEVNFQTGFELIAEEIIDGNVQYLDWASSFIPHYNVTNETKAVENTSLSDTNEAFTFRDNFIEKKYGTLPPNHTIFAGLDLESNSNNSMQRIPRQEKKSYQDLLNRIKKGEQFPPGAKFPGMEMEQYDDLRAISEQEEELIRESLRLLRERRNRKARRNFRMRQHWCNERNPPEFPERNMPRYYQQNAVDFQEGDMPRYYQRNAEDFQEGDMPRYYQQNAADFQERDMPEYYRRNAADFQEGEIPRYRQRNAADFRERGVQRNYQRNGAIFPKRDMQAYYEEKARELYGREMPAYDIQDGQDFTAKDLGTTLYEEYDPQLAREDKHWYMKNEGRSPGNRFNEKVIRPMNVQRNSYKNMQYSGRAKVAQTSRSRSFMDVIKSLIYSDPESKVTIVNKARVAPTAAKFKGRMGARRMTENYQPYNIIHDHEMNGMHEHAGFGQGNAINHYIYVHHVGHPNVDNVQKFKNERKPAEARRSRVKKNERQAPKARQNFRAKAAKVNGMETGYAQRGMNNAQQKYKSMNARRDNIAQNNPAGIHRFYHEINNQHVPGALHPQAENNFAHFHEVNRQANHFNPQCHLHEISKGQNLPSHQSIHQDHQFDKAIYHNHMRENMNSPRVHPQQFAENAAFHYNQQRPLHEVQHIRPQNEQKEILRFHPHNEAIQQINKLPAVHINRQNIHGYQYQPYRAGSVNNPNNLPVMHQVAIRQPNQGIPNVEAAMRNSRRENAAKIGQSRKVNAPRARNWRGGKLRAVRARKSGMVTSLHQYNVHTEGHTPFHFIDVVQYHYEPRQNMRMLQ